MISFNANRTCISQVSITRNNFESPKKIVWFLLSVYISVQVYGFKRKINLYSLEHLFFKLETFKL